MTRWMHPPEIARDREPGRFDPSVEGARHGLSRELSAALWQRVRAEATDGAGRCDTAVAQRRFHELAVRLAARGGRLRPDVGRTTRVAAETAGISGTGDDSLASWTTELRLRAPGRDTLVASELRRWDRAGQTAAATAMGSATASASAANRAPGRDLLGAAEVARAMAALQYPAQDRATPLPTALPAEQRRPRDVDLRAWTRPTARPAAPKPDWLAEADRAAQVREAVRLHRAGDLAEALRRGRPGLAEAVAAALHDGAILAPHPVDELRDRVRGLGADLTVAGHSLGRAAARFVGTTRLAPVGQRAFAAADAWTGGAARAWSDRARGWADGVARRAMASRDA
ncbi:MAG TPA: hypothetical protein VGD37_00305, partial [Kofleriaceae bacterium]